MYNVVVIATHMQCYEVKVLYVFKLHLLDRLEAIACRADLSFSPDVFFSHREISEMRGPTGVKFCMMVNTGPNFIIPIQNFGGAPVQWEYNTVECSLHLIVIRRMSCFFKTLHGRYMYRFQTKTLSRFIPPKKLSS